MSSREEIIAMLHPMSKEQIMGLLADAAVNSIDIKGKIENLANRSQTHRKIFVRGLPWIVETEKLVSVFAEKYGPVEEGAVITDRNTGRSRGFGFVTFKSRHDADRSLEANGDISLFGREIMVKLAATPANLDIHSKRRQFVHGLSGPPMRLSVGAVDVAQRRLFVRGLDFSTTTETFLEVFSQYGEIEEGTVIADKNRSDGGSKGFGFVTFKTRDAALRALEEPNKDIDGRRTTAIFAAKGSTAPNPHVYNSYGMMQRNAGPYAGATAGALRAPYGAYGGYPAPGATNGAFGTPSRGGYGGRTYSAGVTSGGYASIVVGGGGPMGRAEGTVSDSPTSGPYGQYSQQQTLGIGRTYSQNLAGQYPSSGGAYTAYDHGQQQLVPNTS